MQRKTQDVERQRSVAEGFYENKKYQIEDWPKRPFRLDDMMTVFQPHEKDIIITQEWKI